MRSPVWVEMIGLLILLAFGLTAKALSLNWWVIDDCAATANDKHY